MSHQAFKRALGIFEDNQSKFAAAIGTSQQLVSYWLKNGKSLPAELVLKTEEATNISRHDLRPDLYPRESTQPETQAA